MTKLNGWKKDTALMLVCVAAVAANAQTFTTLVDFNGTNGENPWFMSMVQGRDGNFYGATIESVFKISSEGTLGSQFGVGSFNGLILAEDGNFYGIMSGYLSKITSKGTIDQFCSLPIRGPFYAGVVLGNDGNFYGTTYQGGISTGICAPQGCGTVFKVTPTCVYTTIHSFDGTDGANPYSTLIQTIDGSFYGTTYLGGASDEGTVFKVTSKGSLTSLHSFNGVSDGDEPTAGLVEGSDGNFYGTTYYGLGGVGSVFKMTPSGDLTTLAYDGNVGCQPYGGALIQATDGNFYGTFSTCGAYNYGSVAQITPTGVMTAIHSFDNTDGANPFGGLVQGTDGKIYGATTEGGDLNCSGNDGCGTVFSIDMGLGPFVAFVRPYGKVGQTGGILGQGFTGTTSVMLNGIPVNFTVVSDTFIKATVPPGASTGYVTVTTPTGVLTSNVPFHVIP